MTQTQEIDNDFVGFEPAQPRKEPITSNIGYVSDIGEIYKSEKSKSGYYVCPITIHGVGAGKEQRIWVCFQPEWLKRGFKSGSLENKAGRPIEMYRKSVADTVNLGVFQAISGTKWTEFCKAVDAVPLPQESSYEDYCLELTQTLTDFFTNNREMFGYILHQESSKVEGEWVRSKYMSIQNFYVASEDNLEKERLKARKTAEKIQKAYDTGAEKIPSAYRVTFDDGQPF